MGKKEITIKKESLWKYSTFALAAVLIIVLLFSFSGKDSASSGSNKAPDSGDNTGRVEIDIEGAPVLGEKNAQVTIVEFSDYQCPFCRKFWQETLPSIKKDYIDSGKVKLVYMDFPLGFHPGAVPYAEAARCAGEKGDDAYYKMHDKIFEEQNKLDGGSVRSTIEYTGDEALKKWAKDIGYDIGACLDSGRYADAVQEDLSYGSSLGVQGTPGFFINGQMVSGAQPYSVFKQIIDAELNK
ncbi:MAG TPA: DsbA family protein [Candidatus Nanoarchaeia archaeon]|nr:DsbA family protein [Candidatus Nanoarchaeia archaeon]